MSDKSITQRKWFYPLIYLVLVFISFVPVITEVPYDPRNSQEVIFSILAASMNSFQNLGWIFHVCALLLVGLVLWRPRIAGRVVAAYFGLNYFVIAAIQNTAHTEQYGFSVLLGAMIAEVLLGFLWLWVAWKGRIEASRNEIPPRRWLLLPLALLVFWSPVGVEGMRIVPHFNPLLLLTSPDYGLAYCFMTPVFLFFLILFYPKVDTFAFRVTAFNGLLYGLFNLSHWFDPDRTWMGVMHLPLLVIPVTALVMTHLDTKRERSET